MLVVDSSEEGCAVLDSNDLQAGQEVMLRACRCVALFVCCCASETVAHEMTCVWRLGVENNVLVEGAWVLA